MDDEAPAVRRIVVGVDGSAMSRQALRWAIEQARLSGSAVDAVTAWTYPTIIGWAMTEVDPQIGRTAEKSLARTVEEEAGLEPPVEIRQRALPAEVLLEEARGADLPVVGSRGHGSFERALLGSVSQHCVQHAPCPVVVVRGTAGGLRRVRGSRPHRAAFRSGTRRPRFL